MSHFTFENDKKYIQIVTLGCRFNSPEERYRVGARIVCDRCQSTPVMQGYGLGNQDLCLPCVAKVRASCSMPDLDDPLTPTLMCQRQFRPPSEELTFMLQDQYQDEPVSITNMRQMQYNIKEQNHSSDEEPCECEDDCGLFDGPIPAAPAQHANPRAIPDVLYGTGVGRPNGNHDQFAERFNNTIQITSQNTKPTNPESGWRTKMISNQYSPESGWRTKMISNQYMEDCLTGHGRGRNNGDELARRLEEMQRLRDQPIPDASNINDLPGFSIGGSSLESQFGSLLSTNEQRTTNSRPPPPESTSILSRPTYSIPKTESGMFKTRMAVGMFQRPNNK